MPVKKCSKCGMPVGNLQICPSCGARVQNDYSRVENQPIDFFEDDIKKDGKLKMNSWDIGIIILSNLSLIAIIINLILGGEFICRYPILGMFFLYFMCFTFTSKSFSKFVTRFRNTIFILNFIVIVFAIIIKLIAPLSSFWDINYYAPISLIFANTLLVSLLAVKKVSFISVLYSVLIFLSQSISLLIILLIGITNPSIVSRILIISAFGINVLTVANMFLLKNIKFRHQVQERFNWWE